MSESNKGDELVVACVEVGSDIETLNCYNTIHSELEKDGYKRRRQNQRFQQSLRILV